MIPEEYYGREHTYLKHLILKKYLESWGYKISSISKYENISLFYVDCFSGPWKSANVQHKDTSIYISLKELNSVTDFWRKRGYPISTNAIFVEKNKNLFLELEELVNREKKNINVITFCGEFGDYVKQIKNIIKSNPALLFIDPTGWKGASMKYIAPLVDARYRDVIVNVMVDHINRFKDSERLSFIKKQMEEFFEEKLRSGLNEEDLMSIYRKNIKQKCGLVYAADLVIPYPTRLRTKYRLVVGGKHPEVIKLFRDIEENITGELCALIKAEVKDRQKLEKTGQLSLDLGEVRDYTTYDDINYIGKQEAGKELLDLLQENDHLYFKDIWPTLLEKYHITYSDLKNIVKEMTVSKINIRNKMPNDRTIKDDHSLALKNR